MSDPHIEDRTISERIVRPVGDAGPILLGIVRDSDARSISRISIGIERKKAGAWTVEVVTTRILADNQGAASLAFVKAAQVHEAIGVLTVMALEMERREQERI